MSEMEKILQNWNTADEYLNEKIDKSKTEVLDETVSQEQFVAENMIPVPYYRPSGYVSAAGMIINYDDTGITTFTNSTALRQYFALNGDAINLDRDVYILHGCPKGGSDDVDTGNYCITAFKETGAVGKIGSDTGDGLIIDNRDGSIPQVFLRFYIRNAEGKTFYPMLEKGTVAHNFQPCKYSRKSLEERITALESTPSVGEEIVWIYLDTNNRAIQIENIDNCYFPAIFSYMSNGSYNYPISGGIFTIYTNGSSKYVHMIGTERNADSLSVVPVSGKPTVFTFPDNAKIVLGIPKPCIEQFGISVVNR